MCVRLSVCVFAELITQIEVSALLWLESLVDEFIATYQGVSITSFNELSRFHRKGEGGTLGFSSQVFS